MANPLTDTRRFYDLLNGLASRVGGVRRLAKCSGRMDWPRRGLYFFYEIGEVRSGSGAGSRVVHIGTHGLKAGSRSTLWGRLSQHRGTSRGVGNHRGSIFRLLVGIALARRHGFRVPVSWGVGGGATEAARRLGVDRAAVQSAEADLEAHVSRYIGDMPFLWLEIGDEPGPGSQRGLIKRNAIALLSSHRKLVKPDRPSPDWLGHSSDRERVRQSGLWNNRHVEEDYASSFLDILERQINLVGTR